MVFSDLLLTFICFWALIHVLYRILSKSSNRTLQSISRISRISSTTTSHLPTVNPNLALHEPSTLILSYFCLRYQTNKFNTIFESIAKKAPRFWRIWFDIGVLVGLSAMIIGVCVMIVAGWKLLMGMIGSFGSFEFKTSDYHIDNSQKKLVKRSEEINHLIGKKEGHQVFIPVIPGVTLPTSHLLYYLIALFICGVIHEAGHAIAAYCESVPIKHAGVFLYFLYPGAFVNFSDLNFSKCILREKLRILCAGVWHNVVIFVIGLLILNSGIVTLSMNLIGYKSVEGTGVSVISVENTDLIGVLHPSTLITKLDDYELDDTSLEKWNNYLLRNDKVAKSSYGFCTSEKNITSSLDCCDITSVHPYGNSKNKEISCFQRSDQSNSHYQKLNCLHARPILVNMNEQRCKRDSDCDNPLPMCVLPYTPAGFPVPLRIYFKYPPWIANEKGDKEQVLLWLGGLEDLWEIIQVSILQPRWSWVPLWIPFTLEIILRYMVSFSLALCILNILPAFQLDGHHALTEILTWLYEVDDRLGTITTSISKRKRQRKKIENGIVYITTCLVGWVVFGTLISGIFFNGH